MDFEVATDPKLLKALRDAAMSADPRKPMLIPDGDWQEIVKSLQRRKDTTNSKSEYDFLHRILGGK